MHMQAWRTSENRPLCGLAITILFALQRVSDNRQSYLLLLQTKVNASSIYHKIIYFKYSRCYDSMGW